MDMRETPEHRNRNDDTFLITKRHAPNIWQKLLAALTPEERAQVETRVKAAEQREGQQS